MTLLEKLRKLRYEGPSRPLFGICGQVRGAHREGLYELFRDMGLDPVYPVEGVGGDCRVGAFCYADAAAMWDRAPGTYGANRWALLDRMIAFLEENPEWTA